MITFEFLQYLDITKPRVFGLANYMCGCNTDDMMTTTQQCVNLSTGRPTIVKSHPPTSSTYRRHNRPQLTKSTLNIKLSSTSNAVPTTRQWLLSHEVLLTHFYSCNVTNIVNV